nr:MAG TPA: hypothetical protein [Caudoviricetes sp.]DAS85791.1 MAG TPA: hypothetical protein [Caudoviricetes sp.]
MHSWRQYYIPCTIDAITASKIIIYTGKHGRKSCAYIAI